MTAGSAPPTAQVAAAGTLPWRLENGRLEVALIHRPRYDDWSWPKGKLDPGEDWPVAAARETLEETGHAVALGRTLPRCDYVPMSKTRQELKRVRYWAARVVGGAGTLEHEVDEVRWLAPEAARDRLTYERDHAQLDALVAAHEAGALDTRVFAVVRHAKARPRKDWHKHDWLRPLDAAGRHQAVELVPLLGAYGITSLLSSSSTRCVDTFVPYAKAASLRLETTAHLSEESFVDKPRKAVSTLLKAFAKDDATAVCSHGPLLPDLLTALADYAADDAVADALTEAAADNLAKGEALVTHVAESADGPRIVDLERHVMSR